MSSRLERARDILGLGESMADASRSPGMGLPAFHTMEAALATRVRTWRHLYFATTSVLVAVIVLQQRTLSHRLFDKMNEQIVIVPGSPEFHRVRPGMIPDESVFIFAEYVADNLGTFSYRSAKSQFAKIMSHLSPPARVALESALDKKFTDWLDRRVDQVFAYDPVKKFDVVTDEKGAKYLVAVEGVRSQYVEGRAFGEVKEVLALEFRSRGNLTADRPFVFEVEKIDWLTPEQHRARKDAMAALSKK